MNELLEINQSDRTVFYLGYPLKLTKSEFCILSALADNKDGYSTEELLALVFTDKKLQKNNIAVHIFNINKKAKMIGGRNIILGEGKYRLTEYL